MKLFVVIVLGVFASFALTILSEQLVFGLISKGARLPFAELGVVNPLIALIVGTLAGLFMKNKTRVAAALSLAPWTVWLVLATNGSHSTVSRWATLIVIGLLYLALGIGAAIFVGGRMAHTSARGSHSPS
jgi:Ni/Fe-hydrogenase subunit HybB-like protein